MSYTADPDFSTMASRFEDWIAAAKQDRALLKEGGDGPRLGITRLGWRRARTTGRGTEGLRIQADYLCTITGASSVLMDETLAALYSAATPFFEECAPLPPEAELWRSLKRAPEPALKVSLTLQIRPEKAPEPPALIPVVSTGAMVPISGRVVHGRQAVKGALIRPASDSRSVTSDDKGHFRLPHWRGDPLIVRKGNTEIEIRPKPGKSDILIDLKAES